MGWGEEAGMVVLCLNSHLVEQIFPSMSLLRSEALGKKCRPNEVQSLLGVNITSDKRDVRRRSKRKICYR